MTPADGRSNYVIQEDWVTVGVTPLPPGWRNVAHYGRGQAEAEPCPAMLLQELRETGKAWDQAPDATHPQVRRLSSNTVHEEPYRTRVIFGGLYDPVSGQIWDVEELYGESYLGSIPPDEDVQPWQHERAEEAVRPVHAGELT